MSEDRIEEFIENQAIKHCLGLHRVKRLMADGHASKNDIESTAANAVKYQREGRRGRMRASDCIEAAESAVRQRYKGIKLSYNN